MNTGDTNETLKAIEALEVLPLFLSPEELCRLVESHEPTLRRRVALHPHTPRPAWRRLLKDPDPTVRLAAAVGHADPLTALRALRRPGVGELPSSPACCGGWSGRGTWTPPPARIRRYSGSESFSRRV